MSGSPVFLNLGAVRQINGKVKFAAGASPIFFLLGLIHGHFDSPTDDAADDDTAATEKINAGIAIVVPISKVREVIDAYEAAPAAANKA